ncbi:MAG: YraN family protein [Ignavibacteriales bacterium]|nr:YraN family protein [Ignavibacteriales bacterium]MCF8305708.1 YraN family protein [Ignavibacteriales bacterium]MCF8315430.1 YraN family protein [Ignavibacteriales bacterium]MCF8437042.1 YraN family protein [Ignavibacteriales bacterium]
MNKGKLGEEIAIQLLRDKGYRIIESNYHFGHGEIDIIAEEEDTLVFIEVKLKTNLDFGEPEYSVTKSKQKQIRRIAEAYLYEKGVEDKRCRMDVISILYSSPEDITIKHIENAF